MDRFGGLLGLCVAAALRCIAGASAVDAGESQSAGVRQPDLSILRSKATTKSVVAVMPTSRLDGKRDVGDIGEPCSGVIVETGLILTTARVASGTSGFAVLSGDGERVEASRVALRPEVGLAILRADTGGLQPLPFGDVAPLKPGDWVVAVGRTLSGDGRRPATLTVGTVSALNRSSGELRDLLQTDAALAPGFSGGALLDLEGELVGVILGQQRFGYEAIDYALTSGSHGIGYAVSVTQARHLLQEVLGSKTTGEGEARTTGPVPNQER